MLISLRSDGTAVMLDPSHVYQGSNIVNVYVSAPFPNTTVLQIGFTLPNGTSVPATASAPMTYVQDPENNLVVWKYTIAAAITNEAGAASVSITATTQTEQVIASQSIPFTIEETTLPVLPDTPSQDEWTLVLQYIQANSANIATLQGQISTIEEDVATANDNASEALSTAQSAEETAQSAEKQAQNTQLFAQYLKTYKQDIRDNALTTTSKTIVGAINENVTAIEGLRQDFINEAHFRGYFATNAEVEETPANLNDFAYSAESGTVWIYGADGWTDSGKPVPDQTTPLADTVPLMDGTTGAPGTATSASRADHVHPTDTSRASQSDLQAEIENRSEADLLLKNSIDSKYTKPSTGIPESDLSLSVQQKLNSGGGGASYNWVDKTVEIASNGYSFSFPMTEEEKERIILLDIAIALSCTIDGIAYMAQFRGLIRYGASVKQDHVYLLSGMLTNSDLTEFQAASAACRTYTSENEETATFVLSGIYVTGLTDASIETAIVKACMSN